MSSPQVDLVFLIDASASMKPCFYALAAHLSEVIQPIQGTRANLRLGLVYYNTGVANNGGLLFNTRTLENRPLWDILYGDTASTQSPSLFTADKNSFVASLKKVELVGDENTLVGLDFALDMPFGPIASTKRIVALFSDEKIEDGALATDHGSKIQLLIEKIHARRVKLFAALPISPMAEKLAEADGSEFEDVQGGEGLKGVDFKKLLQQMGKSISMASLQKSTKETYSKGLFGQSQWSTGEGKFEGA